MNLDARNLLNYKPACYYDGTAYSYNEMPKTGNVAILLRYTQRFGHSCVRGTPKSELKSALHAAIGHIFSKNQKMRETGRDGNTLLI